MFRFAELAVRSLLLLNGGAALAVITFASSSIGSATPAAAKLLGALIYLFDTGAALSLVTAGAAYLSQLCFTEFNDNPTIEWYRGGGFRIIGIVAFFLGLAAFVAGIHTAGTEFTASLAEAAVREVRPPRN